MLSPQQHGSDSSSPTPTAANLTLAELASTDLVRCPHCLRPYTTPTALPCLHTYCRQCLLDIVLAGLGFTVEKPKSHTNTKQPTTVDDGRDKDDDADSQHGIVENVEGRRRLNGVTSPAHGFSLVTGADEARVTMVCPICHSALTLAGSRREGGGGGGGARNTCSQASDGDQVTRTKNVALSGNGLKADEKGDAATLREASNTTTSTATTSTTTTGSTTTKTTSSTTNSTTNDFLTTRATVRSVVETSLPINSFLQALVRLYGYKLDDVGRQCQYCDSEGVSVPASSLCLDCRDDMCDACVGAHRKTRVTRDHTVAPYTRIQQGLYDSDLRARDWVPCRVHPAAEATHFCIDCLELVCKPCSRTQTHHSHSVKSAEAASRKLAPEVALIQQGFMRRAPSLSEYIDLLRARKSQLAEEKTTVLTEIKTQAELLVAMIGQRRDDLVAMLEEAHSQEAHLLEGKIADMGVAHKALEESAKLLLHVSQVGRPAELLQLYPSVVGRHRQLVHSRLDALTTRLTTGFMPGPATPLNVNILMGNLELNHGSLGKDSPQVRLSVSSLMPRVLSPVQLVTHFTCSSPSDTRPAYPSGMALNRSMIALVDRDNAKIKLLDHTGKFLKEITGSGKNTLIKPFDVVFLGNGALAVSDSEAGAVRVFDWTGRYITDFQGDIRQPRGMAVNRSGEVVVVDGHLRQWMVHDSASGKMIRQVRPVSPDKEKKGKKERGEKEGEEKRNHGKVKDSGGNKAQHGRELLVDPHYVAVAQDGRLVVTDAASPSVKIVSQDGGLLLAATMDYGTGQDESLHPAGVCVDTYGQILLADTYNSRVHLGLPDGQMHGLLVTRTDGVSHPLSMAIDHDGHLVIAQAGGEVRVFKYI